jgi:hypothetical protein
MGDNPVPNTPVPIQVSIWNQLDYRTLLGMWSYRSGSKVSGLEVPNFVETGIGGKPEKKGTFFFLGF